MALQLFRIQNGVCIKSRESYFKTEIKDWDIFLNDDHLYDKCQSLCIEEHKIASGPEILKGGVLKPAGNQEIWASGVTYFNSKLAREEEAKEAGGGDFYAKVYTAERPELFFKSTGFRSVGHGEKVAIRSDSTWNVPEPELTLYITSSGKIVGYTIGNDMSSRSIEGENPLYLPQAKSYDRSAALGPCIYVTNEPFPLDSEIKLKIYRNDDCVFSGETRVNQIVRKFEDLVEYLFRAMTFPNGVFLMTGTGVVPGADFTLKQGDRISIEIDRIGVLENEVG